MLLAWWFVLAGAGTGMSTLAMTTWQFPPTTQMSGYTADWNPGYWFIMLLMWWVMMIAMMVPSASPMILLYARVARHAQKGSENTGQVVATGSFALGYLLAWLLFSAGAVLLQWTLENAGVLNGMMMWSTSKSLTAGLLAVAGIYQLSPLKSVCLRHCRSPAEFISSHWRDGATGALRMGLDHGLYCVGCCWFLMALLFAGGIMNLVWIVGLAILVLLEKLLPAGGWIARVSGVILIAASVLVLLT